MRRIDLTGHKFGMINVLSYAGRMKSGGTGWNARCDCGTEFVVNGGHLTQKGYPKRSCGCLKSYAKDMVGKTFGRLTVREVVKGKGTGAEKRKTVSCDCECGTTGFLADPYSLRSNHTSSCGCLAHEPKCEDLVGRRFGKLVVLKKAPKLAGSKKVRWHMQCDCGNQTISQHSGLVQGKVEQCPKCAKVAITGEGHYRWIGAAEAQERLTAIFGNKYWFPYIEEEWAGVEKKITGICRDHGEFQLDPSGAFRVGSGCPTCGALQRHESNAKGISGPEKEMRAFIESLGSVTTRGFLNGTKAWHFDVLVEDKKLAFEFNGVYWHSYPRTQRGKHSQKRAHAEEHGYRMVTIWEDDWTYQRGKMEALIRRILLGADTKGARQFNVASIGLKEAQAFHEMWHVQGFVANVGGRHYALYDKGIPAALAAVATFSDKGVLDRYTVREGLSISGGLLRLVKAFRVDCGNMDIVTFCDRDHFTGAVYQASGFEHVGGTLQLSYVNGKKRESRQRYMKHKLPDRFGEVDMSMTERDICAENGVYAAYNSGTDKYVLKAAPE